MTTSRKTWGRPSTIIAASVALVAAESPARAEPEPPKPRLIVQLTFDQLRADLLQRHNRAFTGGLRRILDEGRWIRHGEVGHGLTNSFPGHVTLATGLHPSRHGLTANEWWGEVNGEWTWIGVLSDPRYTIMGAPSRPSLSPSGIRGTTLADWVKAADPLAKTVALATGGATSVAYGGARPDALYWYDGESGGFTSSTYYHRTPHGWLKNFNDSGIAAFKKPSWSLAVPEAFVALAEPDASSYEAGGKNFVFPHQYESESRATVGAEPVPYGRWFGGTPLKDEALFTLAARAVDAERLGQRGHVDYLAVLADSTDSVGHQFGPNSLEQLDTLVRLDRALGAFLDHLDASVGRGRYILALSADHGVADAPEQHGGRRIRNAEIEEVLDRVEALAVAHSGTREALVDKIVDELKKADFIADAYPQSRLQDPGKDAFAALFRNSFRPDRTYDFPLWSDKPRLHHPARYGIIARFKEGMIFEHATAVHGSPYGYDRSVPIVFYGPGTDAIGKRDRARTVDVAPTLASLVGIAAPPGLDGQSLLSEGR